MRWIGFLMFVFLRTTASVLPRKALQVEELCTNGAMNPSIQLSPSRGFPSVVSLSFGQSVNWRNIFFDCTLKFKIVPEVSSVSLGVSFSHLQMRSGGPIECPDYIVMADRSHTLHLCGEMSGVQNQMPHFDSNNTSITIRIISRSLASWQDDYSPFRFKLTIFAYLQVSKKSECIEREGVFCGSKHRCLPLPLLCNGFIHCDDIKDAIQLQKNCSNGFIRTNHNSMDTKLAPITITVVASAIFLIVFLLIVILLWTRKKILARRCRTSSSQDLTEDASTISTVTDPMVYIINPSQVTSDSPSASQEIRYPSARPPLLLTPTPSYSFVQANEAPPTYESLFGFTNGLTVSGKQ